MRALLPFLVATALAGVASAGDVPTLRADAGLGGVCKPGRWTPVRVVLETSGADVTGELVLDWGMARVRQAVALASPSRRQLELYIRTADVRDSITVGLWSGGREIRRVSAPVRIAPSDLPLTVCASAAGGQPPPGMDCTATMTHEALPRSWRGYDAADRVQWFPWGEPALAPDQRRALDQWRAFHRLDAPGNTAGPGVPPPLPGRSGPLPRMLFASYVVSLLVGGFWLRRSRARGVTCMVAYAGVIAVGSVAALAGGRAGPASAVVLRHESVIQQFAGASGSLVSLRGRVEYPTFDSFGLRPAFADGAIDRLPAPVDRREQQFDRNGFPVLAGAFGLGSGQQFELEGVADFAVLEASARNGTVRVANAGRVDLDDCGFSPGFSRQSVGSLRSGESVEAEQNENTDDPVFTCRVRASLFEFFEPRRRVDSGGGARVVYHLRPADPEDDQD